MADLHVLAAGVGGFAAAGGKVVEGRPRWSMERQVRLVAGGLVLAGVLAGRFVHPRAVLLAGGIGAGLTASALTDTCTMGRMLSALPYNRRRSETPSSCSTSSRAPPRLLPAMTTTLLVVLALGLVIGALLGLLGGGGSILAVPALVYGVGLPLAEAVPTSLLVVGISSAAAVLPRLRQVQWRLAGIFSATGAAAAFAGTAVNRLLDPSVVLLGFAAVMVAAAGACCAAPTTSAAPAPYPAAASAGAAACRRLPLPESWSASSPALFGVGGGFLIVPALTLLLGLPMTTAAATSLVVIFANSSAAFTAHLGDTTIDVTIAIAFTVAAILGSVVAGRIAPRLPGHRVRRWFAVLVFLVAAYVAVHATLGLVG